MSDSNAKLHRGILEAYNAGDIETFIASCDPRIEFHSTFSVVGGVYHGRDGIREYFRDLKDAWAGDIHVEAEAYFDVAGHSLACFVVHARGSHSGAEVATPLTQVGVERWPLRVPEVIPRSGGRTARPACLRGRAEADRPMMASVNLDLVRSIHAAWERAQLNAVLATVELAEVRSHD
jgi:hypothetical protein